MHEHGFGFDEASALGPDTPISELLDHEFVDADDPDLEGIDATDIALWSLASAIADRGYFGPPDCELPPIETLGDLLRFLAPFSLQKKPKAGAISLEGINALLAKAKR